MGLSRADKCFSLLYILLIPTTVKCCARQYRECCQGSTYAVDKYIETLGDLPTLSSYYATPTTSGQTTSLSCSFEEGETCAWGNLPGNRLRWKRVRFKQPEPTKNQMKSITSKAELPDGAYAVVGTETSEGGEELTSVLVATIACQRGPGKLKFNHWTNSASNELQVCVVPLQAQGEKNCIASVRRTSPNPIHFTIRPPETGGPFQIRLEARGFQVQGFIMIDDISYDADMCSREQRKPTPNSDMLPVLQESSCMEMLTCDFEQGTSCYYDVKASRSGQWNVGSGRTGNRLVGVQADGSGNPQGQYAFVGHDFPGINADQSSKEAVYIMQSPEVRIKKQLRLYYDVFTRSVGPVLKVCVNDFSTCPKVHSMKNSRGTNDGWTRRESITLKPNVKRLLFVVRNLQANQYVALDNISVEGGQGAC